MPKTKSFRVATSGATIDGRTIRPQDLSDMAATYDPATYQARVNLEHYMSMSPDSTFKAYGDVLALETKPVTLNVGGQQEERLGLYATIDAHDSLVALRDNSQKMFTSIEVTPDFAKTGKAYLSGLAFTDSPASLGTEAMKFRASVSAASPFHFSETQKNALFTPPEETTFEFAETTPGGLPGPDPEPAANGIVDAIKNALRGFRITPEPAPAPPPAPAAPAGTDPAVAAAFGDLGGVMKTLAENHARLSAQVTTLAAQNVSLRADLTAAQAQTAKHQAALEKIAPAQFGNQRRPATGGGGDLPDPKDEIL